MQSPSLETALEPALHDAQEPALQAAPETTLQDAPESALEAATLQRAIDFLAFLRQQPRIVLEAAPVSFRIDYPALAVLARRHGFVLTATSIAEAFRLQMRCQRIVQAAKAGRR
jgi:hypothetical protein